MYEIQTSPTNPNIAVILFDGKPVASVVREDRTHGEQVNEEYVYAGVKVSEPGHRYLSPTLRYASAPTRGVSEFFGEPTVEQVAKSRQDDLDYEAAFQWVRYGERGETVPEDASDAFRAAVKDASKRFSRRVVKGALTGEPRSW